MYRKQVWNKSQAYFDGRFNSGAFFIYLTVRPSTDGKRAPLTAINLQAAGSPQQAPPTYIAKMWKLIKFSKNVIFSRNHTDVNPDDWTITKKTIRTTIHENFSKMKNLKVDRWALSLNGTSTRKLFLVCADMHHRPKLYNIKFINYIYNIRAITGWLAKQTLLLCNCVARAFWHPSHMAAHGDRCSFGWYTIHNASDDKPSYPDNILIYRTKTRSCLCNVVWNVEQ